MGKSSINGPFSMAMLVITRGYFQDFNEGGSAFLATFPETIPVMWLSPQLPSGKHTKNDGKSPFSMGKSTINGNFQ